MRIRVICCVAIGFSFFFLSAVQAGQQTQILYSTTYLDANRWQYTYEVKNISLAGPINEFTIWFDYGLYGNLVNTTPNPPTIDWDVIVVQPEPVLEDDGFYDSLALDSGITVGQTISGFAVSFDWLSTGNPGSQFYEIIEPETFEVIDSGFTVPEPGTIILFAIILISLRSGGKK